MFFVCREEKTHVSHSSFSFSSLSLLLPFSLCSVDSFSRFLIPRLLFLMTFLQQHRLIFLSAPPLYKCPDCFDHKSQFRHPFHQSHMWTTMKRTTSFTMFLPSSLTARVSGLFQTFRRRASSSSLLFGESTSFLIFASHSISFSLSLDPAFEDPITRGSHHRRESLVNPFVELACVLSLAYLLTFPFFSETFV